MATTQKACVVGSGPNGLSAAITLAQAGLAVEVFEAEPIPGGAVRTMQLTLPAFRHDFGSAVYPLGAGSPFFSTLPLEQRGLQWIYSPAVLAHPFDDGTAIALNRDLADTASALGADAKVWRELVEPFVEHWNVFAFDILRPVPSIPQHPALLFRFGMKALRSAESLARRFQHDRTRALFAGLAAHSFLSLDEPLSGAFGMIMAISAHAVGWPIVQGGAQSLTDALCAHLAALGGKIRTSAPIRSLGDLPEYDLILCDVTARQLLQIGSEKFAASYKRQLRKFRYGPGVFKVDYALNQSIPWKAKECLRAATVHLGASFEEIAHSEYSVRNGRHADRPFVLLAQPSLFDSTRAPAGKHTAWAYCHVPNGSKLDMLAKLESQIERFAPGFREIVLARAVFDTARLESMDANLIGGDISGGAMDLSQFLFRPTWRRYATSAPEVYICSASTPPGGGVHGMCGYHAAQTALSG